MINWNNMTENTENAIMQPNPPRDFSKILQDCRALFAKKPPTTGVLRLKPRENTPPQNWDGDKLKLLAAKQQTEDAMWLKKISGDEQNLLKNISKTWEDKSPKYR